MLGPEEEGKISHVVELEISERSKEVKEFPPEEEGKPRAARAHPCAHRG